MRRLDGRLRVLFWAGGVGAGVDGVVRRGEDGGNDGGVECGNDNVVTNIGVYIPGVGGGLMGLRELGWGGRGSVCSS